MMIQVTAAILIKNERILIARWKNTDELAGKWEFPGHLVALISISTSAASPQPLNPPEAGKPLNP